MFPSGDDKYDVYECLSIFLSDNKSEFLFWAPFLRRNAEIYVTLIFLRLCRRFFRAIFFLLEQFKLYTFTYNTKTSGGPIKTDSNDTNLPGVLWTAK